MTINRRVFTRRVAETAAAAAALGALSAAGGAEPPQRPEKPSRPAPKPDPTPEASPAGAIVDTHQHLWDLSKLRLPWLQKETELRKSHLIGDYLVAARGLGIVKAVYMEVAVAPEQHLAEAEYIIGLCRRGDTPTVAAVIGGRPGSEGFREYITRFRDSRYVKGVRQIVSKPEEILDDGFARGIRLLGELGMRFDLCVPPDRLDAGAKLVDRCPGTRFILDHCGNADPEAFRPADRQTRKPQHEADLWRRGLAKLAKRENVVCKISGIVARAPKGAWSADDLAPIVNHCLDEFGPERVMFGSDWPVCTRAATMRQWVTALREIIANRPEEDRRRLMHDNAVRFYGLT